MKKNVAVTLSVFAALVAAAIFFIGGRDAEQTPQRQDELAVPAGSPRAAESSPDAAPAGNMTESRPFRIGIMSGSGNQSEEEIRGAMEMIRLYGDAERGGMIRRVEYPDNFMSDLETTVERLTGLADDPLMKVVVACQAVPGTAEAFETIKRKRPDILCLAGESHEDPNIIASAADLVVNADFISRGYLIPRVAKELGAKTFVHISFPRHMIEQALGRRREIMEQACGDLGLRFVFINAPDPTGDAGIDGARRYIIDNFPSWIERYGEDTAFFCTNDAMTEPIIRQVAELGGFFVEADIPSPLMGFPGAFGIDLEDVTGDWPAILERVENVVVEAGAGGRMGTWVSSLGYCNTAGLAEFGRRVAEGGADLSDIDELLDCYNMFSPGTRWNAERFGDMVGGPGGNYFLIYQDTYVLGKGYLDMEAAVPRKYLSLWSASDIAARAPFHIGIVTGSPAQGADDMLGAMEVARIYGDASRGGMIRHVTYPDNFMDEQETTVRLISELADDPLMKVVVVNQAIPGTAEAFRRIKEKRPDIICLAGEAHEDPGSISPFADLVVNADFISRGYLIPYVAKELGAKTFVHISFPRHMAYDSMSRRRAIMERACADLGLAFAAEEAPDPTGSVGVDGAREYILEIFSEWIEKYGSDAAFFCTNDAHTEPLLRRIASYGGYFVEADVPSPIMGYPGAFGLDVDGEAGNWPVILKKVEDAVIEAGGSGRMGTWAYSLGFCQTAGMAEFGKAVAEGKAKITDTKALLECYGKFSPGARWNGAYYTDAVTGKPIRNYFLIYQDTYVLGRGYMEATSVEIPEEYLLIGTSDETPVQRDDQEGL